MKVLLVEDNLGDARLVQEMLKEAAGDFTLQVAERLGSALKLLSSSQDIEVVLLDLGLPDSRGLETLNKLRAQSQHVPVVIMTSIDDESLGVQAVQLGAQDYLVKGQVDSRLLRRSLTYAIERKETEEALRYRTHKLEAVNKELETFSYSVSHDLRAPLRGIAGFSRLLLEDHADNLDEQGKDYLKRIEQSADLMARLIDDLLKLARLSAVEMEWETVSLSELAVSVANELQASEPGRRVEFNIGPGIHSLGDRTMLRTVLENLMGNAWKFTGKRRSGTIEFGASEHEGQTVYYVRDNGAGFDMDYANKLFLPFKRLHGPTEFPGTGIGLSIVQRIINRHGGRVWADGEVGKGATFHFTLRENSSEPPSGA